MAWEIQVVNNRVQVSIDAAWRYVDELADPEIAAIPSSVRTSIARSISTIIRRLDPDGPIVEVCGSCGGTGIVPPGTGMQAVKEG